MNWLNWVRVLAVVLVIALSVVVFVLEFRSKSRLAREHADEARREAEDWKEWLATLAETEEL